MYKRWTVTDIKEEIGRIGLKMNYPCRLDIEISGRATRRLGAFFYKKKNNIIIPIKLVFAKVLIDGSYPEEVVREVIIHEYLHYYCDTTTMTSNGHNKYFKDMCMKCGISPRATLRGSDIKTNDIMKRYRLYEIVCSRCGKVVCVHKRRDAAERKIRGFVSKCCNSSLKYKDE